MPEIQVLSPTIANQIAAGEVVERPASIVKELVENAIDAGSTAITVEMEGGGVDYLRVTDNGGGIEACQVPTAFLPHATSKIATAADLERIHTLGFRGEALASIAAVAKVSLVTRVPEAEEGTKIILHGGEIISCGPAACAGGTSIEVTDVFYNVPARRKFLKSHRSEAAAVGDLVSRVILSHPAISFRLLNTGKQIYKSAGDGELKNAVYCVYGSEVLEHLRPLAFDDGKLSITGLLGTEQLARPNRLQQSLYVNGRYIRSQRLSFAVQRAYDTRLMGGRFPFFVMGLSIPWEEVDVNVHPQKLEVRFREEDAVFRAVTVACRMALGDPVAPLVRGADIPAFHKQTSRFTEAPAVTTAKPSVPQSLRDKLGAASSSSHGAPLREGVPGVGAGFAAPPLISAAPYQPGAAAQAFNPPALVVPRGGPAPPAQEAPAQAAMDFGAEPYRVVGQLFDCYWVVQQGERVFFIDQHAAHERRLYEALMAGELAGASQMLLLPAVVKLAPAQFDLLLDNLPAFAELGFEVEEFGALTVRVRAVPALLGEAARASDFLLDALTQLEKQGRLRAAELKRATLIQAACKHAVKAGAALAPAEIEALLSEFAKKGAPMTCPHGRPVMTQMTKLEFEKLFKRVL